MNKIKTKLIIFSRHLTQATAACITAMTQGNLATVTAGHWIKALQTGTGAGIIGVLLSFGIGKQVQANRYGVAFIAFIGTVISDFLSHPTHFGSTYSEALVTGVGSAGLCLLISLTPIDKLQRGNRESSR